MRKTAQKAAKKRVKPGKSDKHTRYAAFCEHYVSNGGNAFQAAVSAGYSKNSAHDAAYRLMRHPTIIARLAEVRQRSFAGLEITTDRILREAARMAFFNPRKLVNEQGIPIPLHELDEDTAACVSVEETFDKFGKSIGYSRTFKQSEKSASLEKLFKNMGLFKVDNEQLKPQNVQLIVGFGKG